MIDDTKINICHLCLKEWINRDAVISLLGIYFSLRLSFLPSIIPPQFLQSSDKTFLQTRILIYLFQRIL